MVFALAVLVICCAVGLGAAAPVDLQTKYPFSSVLLDQGGQYYALYWNFTRSTESIYFAVNVSTTGWVGFGLSPNGQMPGSDVVIGWVSNTGESYFADRYARGRVLPVIDAVSQDWFLTNSEEANDYTVLEFSRNFTSCDPQDLDITASTARVVWSFNRNDPTDPSGSDAVQHDYQGSRSLNLIGGTPSVNSAASENEPFLDFTVTNVTIPSASTTYWCETFRLPQQFSERQHYINRFGPALSSHIRAYVHHIIVYQCPMPLPDRAIGVSMPCDDLTITSACRTGLTIGGWAVGGEDFLFPEGISYPIGGTREAMIEMHYDNPAMTEGVVDNSGMRFYYTTEAPEIQAGSISLGHTVSQYMVIPPRIANYTVTGICSADCTQSFPPEGIRIFANNFHTHLAGRGLTIQHFRRNPDCGVLEELEPIDQNLNYDFNFQQSIVLPKEHLVLPGDILVLKCFYETSDRTFPTMGGESTREEMCLSFAYFYPLPPDGIFLEYCQSLPSGSSFNQFYGTLARVDPDAAERFLDEAQFSSVLNGLDWVNNPELGTSLQESITNSPSTGICFETNGRYSTPQTGPVEPVCSYQPPDRCGGAAPLPCCEREIVTGGTTVSTQASVVYGSIMLLLVMIIAV